MTKKNELLPCRCGKVPEITKTFAGDYFIGHCCGRNANRLYFNDGDTLRNFREAKKEAIATWNKYHAPQSVDVEGLKKSDKTADYSWVLSEQQVGEIFGWNECIDHLTTHYDIVKKSEKTP